MQHDLALCFSDRLGETQMPGTRGRPPGLPRLILWSIEELSRWKDTESRPGCERPLVFIRMLLPSAGPYRKFQQMPSKQEPYAAQMKAMEVFKHAHMLQPE